MHAFAITTKFFDSKERLLSPTSSISSPESGCLRRSVVSSGSVDFDPPISSRFAIFFFRERYIYIDENVLEFNWNLLIDEQMLMSQLDPITEQQVMEIYKLQHSSQQAEDALSQGLDQLHRSLTDIIAGGPIIDGINHMVLAMDKLSSLQGFLHQVIITFF